MNLIDIARHLRQQSTETEACLWDLLRDRQLVGYRFRRQHPVGKFVADFACTKYRLIVEADGSQHAENTADNVRTKYLESKGWKVVRFWNNEILSNRDGVLLIIQSVLEEIARTRAQMVMNPSPADHSKK